MTVGPGSTLSHFRILAKVGEGGMGVVYRAEDEKLGDTDRDRHWYECFTDEWKEADPGIPELIEARERLAVL